MAESPQIPEEERQKNIYDILTEIAARQTPESVQAWMGHLEEMRRDKPLFGREED